MAKPIMRIQNLNGFKNDIKGIRKEKLGEANDAIHKAGFFIENEVKASISGQRAEHKSFDTGNMARMVETDNSKFLESKVVGGAGYTIFLEDGTTKIKARNHFKNSAARNEKKIAEFIKKAVK